VCAGALDCGLPRRLTLSFSELARAGDGTDPSPVPRRLARTPDGGHPLPRERAVYSLRTPGVRRKIWDRFSPEGEGHEVFRFCSAESLLLGLCGFSMGHAKGRAGDLEERVCLASCSGRQRRRAGPSALGKVIRLAYFPRWRSALCEVSAAVDDGEDLDSLAHYPVDDAVLLIHQLSNVLILSFRNYPPQLGKLQ